MALLHMSDKVSIYVDYENIRKTLELDFNHIADPSEIGSLLMNEVGRKQGKVIVHNVYGDWARLHRTPTRRNASAAQLFNQVGFDAVNVPSKFSGQDRTDMRLALDALRDLFKKANLTVFIIVAGDSDYGQLVKYIQEEDKKVIVCGILGGRSMSKELLALADEVIPLDPLLKLPEAIQRVAQQAPHQRQYEWVVFIETLQKASNRLAFVGLKLFRDQWITPVMGAETPEHRHEMINEAITQQIVELYSVDNPSFGHSTAAIRLNKDHPLVVRTFAKFQG